MPGASGTLPAGIPRPSGSAHPARQTLETPLPQPEPAREDLGPLVGRSFGGYEIVSYIGEGPSGAVYRGEDLLGNAMAVKVLHAGLASRERTSQLRADLLRLSGLQHPQLQHIHDTGYGDEGQFYYVTDELVGCDLETGLEESGGLAPRKSYEIIRAVLVGLDAAHRSGVIHGGIRPRNVFLIPADSGTTVKVLDFGAARLGGGSDRGIIAGLPTYLAPEQLSATSNGASTVRSDLYAVGVLMYELFSGAAPEFRGGHATLSGHRGPVAPPAGVDAVLARIILSLLDGEPARRPASAAAVIADLDRWALSQKDLLDPNQVRVVRRRGPSTASGSISPDSTVRMSKFDAIALAQETLPTATQARTGRMVHTYEAGTVNELEDGIEADDAPATKSQADQDDAGANEATAVVSMQSIAEQHAKANKGQGNKRNMAQNPTTPTPPVPTSGKDPNSSESVEASLEDFISQANAAFPTTDGWDLHTGDVELVEDEATGATIAQVRPTSKPTTKPAMAVPTASAMPAVGEPVRRTTERVEAMPAPAAPAASGASWTQNPLIVGGIVLGAVVVGAAVMFMAIRTMVPTTQPVIIAQPPAPAVAPAPQAAPVVTSLPAAQPAAQPAAAQPVAAQPVAAQPAAAPAAAPVVTALPPAARPAAAAPAPEETAPAAPAPAPKKAAPKKAAAAPAPKKEAAAPAKKEAAPAKKESAPAKKENKKGGGSDWVDPFAS